MNKKYRGMIMNHMIADSPEELRDMVRKIGVSEKWIQKKGQYNEHFDICLQKKSIAIAHGAIPVTVMELGRMLAKRRPVVNTETNENKEVP